MEKLVYTKPALESLTSTLLGLMNKTWNVKCRLEAQKVLEVIVERTGSEHPSFWIGVVTNPASIIQSNSRQDVPTTPARRQTRDDDGDDEEGDGSRSNVASPQVTHHHEPIISWYVQVFSLQVLRLLILSCKQKDRHHFEPVKSSDSGDHLFQHLNKIASTAFKAASSPDYVIQKLGISVLREVILCFGPTRDPEFPESSILEPFIAQVFSSVRQSLGLESPEPIKTLAVQLAHDVVSSKIFKDDAQVQKIVTLLWSVYDQLPTLEKEPISGDYQFNVFLLHLLRSISLTALLYVENKRCTIVEFLGSREDSMSSRWISFFSDYAKLSYQPTIYKAQEGHYFSSFSRKLIQNVVLDERIWIPITHALCLYLSGSNALSPKRATDAIFTILGYAIWLMSKMRPIEEKKEVLNFLAVISTAQRFWISCDEKPYPPEYLFQILDPLQQLIESPNSSYFYRYISTTLEKICVGLLLHNKDGQGERNAMLVETILQLWASASQSNTDIDPSVFTADTRLAREFLRILSPFPAEDSSNFCGLISIRLIQNLTLVEVSAHEETSSVLLDSIKLANELSQNLPNQPSWTSSALCSLRDRSKQLTRGFEFQRLLLPTLRLLEDANEATFDASLIDIVRGCFIDLEPENLLSVFQTIRQISLRFLSSPQQALKLCALEILFGVLDLVVSAVSVLSKISETSAVLALSEACKLIILLFTSAGPDSRHIVFDVYSSVLLYLMKPANPTNIIAMSVQLFLHTASIDPDVFRTKVASLEPEQKYVLENAVRILKGGNSSSTATDGSGESRPTQKQTIQLKTFGSR